jgi:hypothetical protein
VKANWWWCVEEGLGTRGATVLVQQESVAHLETNVANNKNMICLLHRWRFLSAPGVVLVFFSMAEEAS